MNFYEALVIFKPVFDADTAETALKAVEETVKNLKGTLHRTEKTGRKRLAYDIDRFKDGFLATFVFELPSDAVEAFRRSCQLNEDILRMTLLRKEGLPPEKSLETLPPEAQRARRRPGGGGYHGGGGRPYGGPRRHHQEQQPQQQQQPAPVQETV